MKLIYIKVFILLLAIVIVISCDKEKESHPCNGMASVTVINKTSLDGIYVHINADEVKYVTNQETFDFLVDMHTLYILASPENVVFGWEEKTFEIDDCDHVNCTWYDYDFN